MKTTKQRIKEMQEKSIKGIYIPNGDWRRLEKQIEKENKNGKKEKTQARKDV